MHSLIPNIFPHLHDKRSPSQITVAVGMSGGVDSAVSALLLKEAGFKVIGIFMKNWEEQNEEGVCLSAKDWEDVSLLCEHLQIPCYSVNFVKEYQEQVFSHFLKEYAAGYTPNPDILCNREIKFKVFLEQAKRIGADYLATGHYAQIDYDAHGQTRLLRGIDRNKDQSYFLYTLHSEQLRQVLFPIGHLTKPQVRQIAAQNQLHVSEKKDSTGICFIGKRNFREFLSKYIDTREGPLMTPEGKVVGTHIGLPFYTIGQRHGLAIGGEGAAWFVAGKDPERNAVIVVQGEEHPLLYGQTLIANELSWVLPTPPQMPYECSAKIRYRCTDVPCTMSSTEDGHVHVQFPTPQKAITPRQSIVFYQGEVCLGGGMIHP